MFELGFPARSALEDHLARESDQLVTISFAMSAGERAFTQQDAAFAHALVNLPDRGRLPMAFITGRVSGADLALALFCPLIALAHGATMSTGFGRPGSAAVYVAAARHIGPVACERLLFGASAATAESTEAANLAKAVASEADSRSYADQRIATLISVARANLITWPMPLVRFEAIIDQHDD